MPALPRSLAAPRPGTVCIVDEASALGTRDLARLAEHLSRGGGALKLIGDPDQLSSVDVGGAFRAIADMRGERLVSLTANNRQQDEIERLAVADYREGASPRPSPATTRPERSSAPPPPPAPSTPSPPTGTTGSPGSTPR